MAKFSHEAPKITILSDHPAQDWDKGDGIGEVEHIADRDLLTLESLLPLEPRLPTVTPARGLGR